MRRGATIRLEAGPASATGVARTLVVALARLARRLDSPLDDEAVHGVRKDLKRARATLRLLQPALARRRFRGANLALRDAGRALAGRRDARVLADTLRRLAAHERVDARALAPLAARLRADLRTAAGAGSAAAPAGEAAASLVRSVAVDLRAARVRGDWSVLAEGLRDVYRRGRTAARTAAARPTPACLHEWRKQVKHFWYALELLESAQPKPMGALAREARRLSDRLGEDHDLAVLRERLASAEIDERARRQVLDVLDARRLDLQRSASQIGKRLYAEPPKRFRARLGAWYQAGSDRSG